MMRFTLPNGRGVEMTSLHILRTKRNEATASTSSRENQRGALADIVKRIFPDEGIPFTIVWPVHESIPQVTCIASFRSSPMSLLEFEGYSDLVVCWFVHYAESSVANIVCEGLSRLDWEGNARDLSFW